MAVLPCHALQTQLCLLSPTPAKMKEKNPPPPHMGQPSSKLQNLSSVNLGQ